MDLTFMKWMFINLMVAVGVLSITSYLPRARDPKLRDALSVLGATVVCLFCMAFPFLLAPGIILDLRPTPLGLTGWRYGWRWALIPMGAIVAVRLWLGGPGMVPAVAHAVFCVAVVPFFTGRKRTLGSLAAMGLTYWLGFFGVMMLFVTPRPSLLAPLSPLYLMVLAVSIISLWVMDLVGQHLMRRNQLEYRLERELRSKEAVLELIPYGIVFLNEKREATAMNQAASLLIGGNKASFNMVVDCPEVAAALHQHRRLSGCRVTSPDGDAVLLVSAVPLPDGGAVLGLENVTQVIEQERSGAERERMELLGRLAAMAAHEVKNPLTTIKGFLQLLAARPEFQEHRATFGLVQGEVEHINRVVSDFLALSGLTAMHPAHLSVDCVLKELLDVMLLQFPGSRVAVSLEGDSGVELFADPRAFKQILKNLVANAYEAMPEGGSLSVRRERKSDEVTISLADTGPGIPAEVLSHIFRPYTTTKTTGTGLGLAISHKLANEMGGRLEVSSVAGGGSTFRLTLPLLAQAQQDGAPVAVPQ